MGQKNINLGLLVDRFRLLLNEYSTQWEHRGATNRPVPYLQWCGVQIINVALLFSVTWLSGNMTVVWCCCRQYVTVVWWCCRQDMTESMWFQFGDRLQQFGQRFGVPLGVSRLLQGFWLLDHGDFEVGLIYGCLVSSRSIECFLLVVSTSCTASIVLSWLSASLF